jgi:hypothetical protein
MMAGRAGTARWAVRGAASVATLVLLTVTGWTHRSDDSQYLNTNVRTTAGPAGTRSADAADPVPTPSTVAQKALWFSGASSESAADGRFGRWRGEPVTFGGTWDNGNKDMVALTSICPGGAWAKWRRPLDIAIGAIDRYQGESWAKAARGAYDARWRRSLQRMKTCWGSRDPGNLYIRLAHEYNLTDMPWRVAGGEEAAFVKALTRFSDLRYQILPKAKLVLCPSDGTSGGLGIDLRKTWPGRDARGRQIADVYGVDTYNSWVVIKNRQEFIAKLTATQSGQPLGLELHRQMAQAWGVPFAVCEWSGNGDPRDEGHGADLPIYYQLMNQWFREHAGDPRRPGPGQLLYEIQFNYQPRFMLLPTKVQPKSASAYRKLKWGS